MARQGAISLEELITNKVANFRRWKVTKLFKKQPRWSFQFSIMTYNILSQTAVENHRYLYKHCSNSFLQEDYRLSRILPEILNSKTDIICLQEIEQHLFYNQIQQLFGNVGFDSIFKKRTTCKSDGCAIFWRKSKFTFLRQKEVEFRIPRGNDYLNRDNVGLIAVLKPIHPNAGNTQLHVATTHLLYNPKRGEVKLCQLRLLLAELERMALKEVTDQERIYHPAVLCGDFNIEPHSPLYDFIESGHIDVADTLSGDLSGQAQGRKKGKRVNGKKLSMHKLGISEFTRFEEIPTEDRNHVSSSEHSQLDASNRVETAVFFNQTLASNVFHGPMFEADLLAIGKEQLASEISASFLNNENVPNNYGECSSQVEPSPDETTDTRFSHDFKFVPVYNFHYENQKSMPITSMTNEFTTVDHIFYNVQKKLSSSHFSEGQLRLLGVYTLMSRDEITDLGGLPNAHLGSDHICLIAQFGMSFRYFT